MTAFGNDLYCDLFSTGSLDIHPENKVSSFTVKLSQPLDLRDRPYEVALCELVVPSLSTSSIGGDIIVVTFPETIRQKSEALQTKSYPFVLPNFIDATFRPQVVGDYMRRTYTPKSRFMSQHYYTFKHTLSESHYFSSGQEVVEYLNKLFQPSQNSSSKDKKKESVFQEVINQRHINVGDEKNKYPITFSLSSQGKLEITLRDVDFKVLLPPSVARVLGFAVADNQYLYLDTPGVYKFPTQEVSLQNSRTSILALYSDVILPIRVADTTAPLLRVVTLKSINKEHQSSHFLSFQFDTLNYLPVANSYIQEITFEVRTNSGELASFQSGLTYARLHFRVKRDYH